MSFQKHLMVRLAVDNLSGHRQEKLRGSTTVNPATADRRARLWAVRRLFQRFWRLGTGKRNQTGPAGGQAATPLVD